LPDLPSLLRWPEWQERPLPFLAQIRLSDIAPPEQRKEADAYIELEQQLEAFYENETLHHQLLSHPFQIQGDLLWECQQDTGYARDPTDWRLLLQIDTDDDAGVMWGDVGILYFYIPQQALAARDFSQVHLIMQCS